MKNMDPSCLIDKQVKDFNIATNLKQIKINDVKEIKIYYFDKLPFIGLFFNSIKNKVKEFFKNFVKTTTPI